VIFDPVYTRNEATDWHLLFATPVTRNDAIRGAIILGISQKLVQDYMRTTTLSDQIHALVDERGTLVASSENTFSVTKGSWLKTLPKPLNDLSVSMLFLRTFRHGGGLPVAGCYRGKQHAHATAAALSNPSRPPYTTFGINS
jgi:hypothetical protein